LIRTAEEAARNGRSEGLEAVFFAVGRKPLDHFRRTRQLLAGDRINNTPRLATVELARAIAAMIVAQWHEGAILQAWVVYSQFRSAMSQHPVYERLLPIKARPADDAEGSASPVEYLVEPSAAELAPLVLQNYIEASIFHALLEAEASEHGARMTAMDAATNNAIDMISRLTLEMNRARQAAITKELMDIVGGAEALRG
jgi:F-type H+-transporting ATPase subunit gamma